MVKSLIKIVVLIVAVVGGGFAGSFVKNMGGAEASESHAKSEKGEKDSHGKTKKDVLGGDLTSPETYESIRETLLGSSRRVLKDGVSDVLILDLAKRDTP